MRPIFMSGFPVIPRELLKFGIFLVLSPPLTSRVFWNDALLNKFVQLVKINIAEYWRDNATLGSSTQRWVVTPFFAIFCLDQVFDESEEPIVFDFLHRRPISRFLCYSLRQCSIIFVHAAVRQEVQIRVEKLSIDIFFQ